jgi:hypothetical protein
MSDVKQLVDDYIALFNDTDASRRSATIERLFGEDGRYTDPAVALKGKAEIEAWVAATQEQFPGYVFALGSAVDAHHEQARFNWIATAPGASEPEYVGFDVFALEGGRLREVFGFMDKMPS